MARGVGDTIDLLRYLCSSSLYKGSSLFSRYVRRCCTGSTGGVYVSIERVALMRILTKIVIFQSVSLWTRSPENKSLLHATPQQHYSEKPTIFKTVTIDAHDLLIPCPKRHLPSRFLFTACSVMVHIVFLKCSLCQYLRICASHSC